MTSTGTERCIPFRSHARAVEGVRQIKLGVNEANAAARALYRSAGFERFGIEPNALYIDGKFYDEELYVLKLRATTAAALAEAGSS
jgi:RimJ/RimL family protein N-acetyltransferase